MTHDYTERYWGHDYIFQPNDSTGTLAHMMGWGDNIKKGDFLILQNGKNTTRYKVSEIKYFSDPTDMWDAKVKFAPRSKS